jgi:hypothetical protein
MRKYYIYLQVEP